MKTVADIAALEALYDAPVSASLAKVTHRITPLYRSWIETSRFLVLSTVGPDGTDASPRGDDGPVVRVVDDQSIWLPDWRGNNRIDNLRNIVRDGRVSLMFMFPGALNVVRVNGTAQLSDDTALTATFEQRGRHPRTVIVIRTVEVYFQCAKALMRSGLWGRNDAEGLPSAGEFVKEQDQAFDAEIYDGGYAASAEDRMW